jgi:MarR family transcriptional regulator, organic hydroperoxide resistance regulator
MTVAERDRCDQDWHQGHRGPRPGPSRPGRWILAREVRDQVVELGVSLGGVAAIEALLELLGIEPSGQVVLAQDLCDGVSVAIAGPQTAVAHFVGLLMIGVTLGHCDPFTCRIWCARVYPTQLDSQVYLRNIRPHIARLAPLMPQLAFALRRPRGELPIALQQAGRLGGRHISVLVSLGVAGPATVSDLAERLDMSTAHASLVVGELAEAGLIDRDHDELDRRRIIVSLSEKAKPAVAEMRNRNAAPLRRFLADLDDAEAERFIDQLATLVSYLRGEPEPVIKDPGNERGPVRT